MDDPDHYPMTAPGSNPFTIVITDSGLGGLSVYAAIAKGLAGSGPRAGISLVYINAWPEKEKGYNHYPDMAIKAAVFDQALTAMAGFKPDALVIACNTLSVIYPYTGFSQITRIPVYDIIGQGVSLAADLLIREPSTGIILFGTPTTADSQIHARQLIHQGITPDRIVSQGCPGLAGKIERNPFDPEINTLIQNNVDQAMAAGAAGFEHTAAALCCTHFGYCRDLFASAVARHTGTIPRILNPNQGLADQVVTTTQKIVSANAAARQQIPEILLHGNDKPAGRPCRPMKHTDGAQISLPQTAGSRVPAPQAGRFSDLNFQILSRVPLEPGRIQAYAALFESHAPQVAAALKNYQYQPDLFHTPFQGESFL
jgi:glutamate racemase